MAKYTAKGTAFYIDKTDSGTFTKMPQILSIDGPSYAVDEVETTDLDSVVHEYRPGLTDPGEVSIEMHYDPADVNHIFLATIAQTPVVLPMRISWPTLPDATLHTFDAFLTGYEKSSGENSDVITATATFKIVSTVVATTAE